MRFEVVIHRGEICSKGILILWYSGEGTVNICGYVTCVLMTLF
jgi:hypothetical protein